MKGKVQSDWCQHLQSDGVDTYRVVGVDTGVDTVLGQGGDGRTDILSDQPTRLQEFHMLYGTKNLAPPV